MRIILLLLVALSLSGCGHICVDPMGTCGGKTWHWN